MAKLGIQTLGELAISRDGECVPLPASKKTRALLAYLVLTGRPQRRDRLCEMFWEIPDDPRAALRWSLSKLRPVVNDAVTERLAADRERVTFVSHQVEIDIRRLAERLEREDLTVAALREMAERLSEPLLDGLDLPNQELFQRWLTAERQEMQRLRAGVLHRLATHGDITPDQALPWSRAWLEADPFNREAAARLLVCLRQLDRLREVETLSRELARRFHGAGLEWPPKSASEQGAARPDNEYPRQWLARQEIHFCTAKDGVRIAYACVGEGPPLVKAANWLTHLELDWDAPIWSPLFRELASEHLLVRYDERGNGLSDWDVGELSFDVFVTDLETVIDALGLERFALLGISQGAAVSIEYAVRHPERVSQLILFGAYAAGWRIDASPQMLKEREAMLTLTETGWGQDNPAYRQVFSSTFMPSATFDELQWFNEFQRRTTSPENAARFLSAFGDIDVRHRLGLVYVPTLVIHSQRDGRIPIDSARKIAAAIPEAEFMSLDSDGHLLLGREPAAQEFVEAVRRFIST
ncbi:alpha/beta fold hydrolase [Pistricoccus aurantiacus]|uniref:Alpha/beta fold hydrolase n=1 Tax=Pistricoccus aurantiacus TaxID=1883414 RepID=A0A5B8SWE7_9GAMM|nr:alpha/beta hydrolase [Pistricoccus aurantiacus]QEA39098.1 alpha/beta fold hydrolase [Pistricoccus aurantiacus]